MQFFCLCLNCIETEPPFYSWENSHLMRYSWLPFWEGKNVRYLLSFHTPAIKVYVIFLNRNCQEDTAKTTWNPLCGDGTSCYNHVQVLVAASGSQDRWYWSYQEGKSLLLGLTIAVVSLDQLCNVICITFGEGASKPIYLTLSKSL